MDAQAEVAALSPRAHDPAMAGMLSELLLKAIAGMALGMCCFIALPWRLHCDSVPALRLERRSHRGNAWAQEEGGKAPQCCLCPISGGALKPTTTSGLWCHATCMQWIPEVSVENVTLMEPVTNITSIQKERWELMCCICKCAPARQQAAIADASCCMPDAS